MVHFRLKSRVSWWDYNANDQTAVPRELYGINKDYIRVVVRQNDIVDYELNVVKKEIVTLTTG